MGRLAYWELQVYALAFQSAMHIYRVSDKWPAAEMHALTDQARRASRAVCVHIAGGWQQREDTAVYTQQLGEAQVKLAETAVWLDFAHECGYLAENDHVQLRENYDDVSLIISRMLADPDNWEPH